MFELCGDDCSFGDEEPHVIREGLSEFGVFDLDIGEKWSLETSVVMGFAFNVNPSRPWGVYRGILFQEAGQVEWKTRWRLVAETFLKWLGQVVEHQERFALGTDHRSWSLGYPAS